MNSSKTASWGSRPEEEEDDAENHQIVVVVVVLLCCCLIGAGAFGNSRYVAGKALTDINSEMAKAMPEVPFRCFAFVLGTYRWAWR